MQFPGARRAAGTLVQSLKPKKLFNLTCCAPYKNQTNLTNITPQHSDVKVPSLYYG